MQQRNLGVLAKIVITLYAGYYMLRIQQISENLQFSTSFPSPGP